MHGQLVLNKLQALHRCIVARAWHVGGGEVACYRLLSFCCASAAGTSFPYALLICRIIQVEVLKNVDSCALSSTLVVGRACSSTAPSKMRQRPVWQPPVGTSTGETYGTYPCTLTALLLRAGACVLVSPYMT